MTTLRFSYSLFAMQLPVSFQLLWLYLPALVLFLLATLLSLSNVLMLKRKVTIETITSMKAVNIILLRRIPKIALILISYVIAIVTGYLIRDAALLNRKEQYNNVLIVDRFDEHSYRLEIDDSRFNSIICSEAKLDWQPGQKMKRLVYEQQSGCKSVVGNGLGFEFWTDKNGNRILFEVKGEQTIATR